MPGQPRKHHYVPQFYLANFTVAGNAEGRLFVFDKSEKKQWKSTPKGTAHKRDFHKAELGAGEDPMIVEKKLGEIEGQWSRAVRSVIENESLPNDESFGDLMLFGAFMAVRVPRIRDTLSQTLDRLSKSQIQLMLATAEGRAFFRRIVEEQGNQKLSDDEFQKLVAFGLSRDYDVNFDQTWHVQQMLRMGIQLAPFSVCGSGPCGSPRTMLLV